MHKNISVHFRISDLIVCVWNATADVARCYNNALSELTRDQIRGRFSIADGHSFKRWNKNLALALIDVDRANGYLTRRLIRDEQTSRDSHRAFMMDLVGELINGKWADAPSEGRMLFGKRVLRDMEASVATGPSLASVRSDRSPGSPVDKCSLVASKQIYSENIYISVAAVLLSMGRSLPNRVLFVTKKQNCGRALDSMDLLGEISPLLSHEAAFHSQWECMSWILASQATKWNKQ
ncbi:hypothetical protein GQ600_536 [Phytophthora cactorum]|nr:hypothetical protein GQ600_536 [Phytophthora cactorum]